MKTRKLKPETGSGNPHRPLHRRNALVGCLLALLGAATAVGCAGGAARVAADPASDAVPAAAPAPVKAPAPDRQGSLWADAGDLTDLYTNVKARQVGDIVTVKIVESAKASNRADTTTGRESSLSAGVETFLGVENRYLNHPEKHPYFNPFGTISGGMSSDFEGNGTTSRSGALTGYLTASVVTVLPNGNLRIIGSREVTVNNERQIMTLAGTVRSRDVSPDNMVLSTFIADARIFYSGSGIVNEKQQPGWMARIIDGIWPF
jgi:flagellar L-ring protein precursor FlgH